MRRARLTSRLLDGLQADLRALRERESSARPSWPADPARFFEACVGHPPDPWQLDVLTSRATRLLLLCSRQSGKSTATSVLALRLALNRPRSLVLVCSPSERQSGELFRTCMTHFRNLGSPLPLFKRTERAVTFSNYSRVLSLPGTAATVRGYAAAALVVIDEAAYVSDELLTALSPVLAVSQGRLVELSTPSGRRGQFYTAWSSGEGDWQRIKVTADCCPRIPASFLETERRSLGERWYRQEYECSFEDFVGQFFSSEEVGRAFDVAELPLLGARSRVESDSALDTDEKPLFPGDSNGEQANF
jgi:Helicase